MTVPMLRDEALELLADEAWVDDGTGAREAKTRALRFLRTQYDAGSRLVGSFFPDNPSPREAAKRERQQGERECAGPARRKLASECIEHEVERLRFLLLCLRQATELVRAVQEQADDMRRDQTVMTATLRTIAGADVERPSLAQVAPAAVDCDIDLTGLFPGLLVHHELVELGRSLGRFGRGHDVRLNARQVAIMRKQFHAGLACFEQVQAADGFLDHDAVAMLVARMLLEIDTVENWNIVLDEAIALNSAITLSR